MMVEQQRLPSDYLERIYAGVLGKLIGVYLGRPFEGWTHQRILKELGHITYYVNETLGVPLVVVDDDISGTFTFPRALQEHGAQRGATSEAIGDTWLNNVIENRTVFWWGGNAISTEHTVYLNLKNGIKAPVSGSICTNGETLAQQIGAQIFIDGWAMLAPGNPDLAVKLAEGAARVSHDGEAFHAAMVWAAMEAEAFTSKDVNYLLDCALRYIPSDCLIARVITNIRTWAKEDKDWLRTRQRIEDKYGYDKFDGICHVVPNHSVMVLALLYGGHSFHEAMHIVNTCGWDTDCNSGNVGCLLAIMHGLEGLDGGPDWRGPIADMAYISSADGGYSINNAANLAYNLCNIGMVQAGHAPLQQPKNGAYFHFALPGSVQGFRVTSGHRESQVRLEQGQTPETGHTGLALRFQKPCGGSHPVEIMTPVFTPAEMWQDKIYEFMACPLVYPGQIVTAKLMASKSVPLAMQAQIQLSVYSESDTLRRCRGPAVMLIPGNECTLTMEIDDDMNNHPIQQVGVVIMVPEMPFEASIWLEYLRWDGPLHLTLQRPTFEPTHPLSMPYPEPRPGEAWWRAWVNGVTTFRTDMGPSFYLAQNIGEGMISYGTQEWVDYNLHVNGFRVNLDENSGVAVRVQGLRRYYALIFKRGDRIALIKARDGVKTELTSAAYEWNVDKQYRVSMHIRGPYIIGAVHMQKRLIVEDLEEEDTESDIDQVMSIFAMDCSWQRGGIGLIVAAGSVSADSVEVSPMAYGGV